MDGASKAKYLDEDDDFNKLLNSSPKKNPKYTNSVQKHREWEALEAITAEKNRENHALNGFDELLEEHNLGEDNETTNARHSSYG
jgi:hypothetical protein